MALLDDFQRVNREHPCPVCGKFDWCLLSRNDPNNPAQVVCARLESEVRFGDAGWLHTLGQDSPKGRVPFRMTLKIRRDKEINFGSMSERFSAALKETPLNGLAEQLGLTAESLDRLRAGWASANALSAAHTRCRESGAWTFPMTVADGRVCGIRLRTRGGFKYSITGSRSGLFMPSELDAREQLLVAEGATDTAALLGLGFHAIGVPSCNTGFKQVRDLILKSKVEQVVVVADGDDVGLRGAHSLAISLRPYCVNVRVLVPQGGAKDVRDWISKGASRADINAAIHRAETLGLKFKLCGTNRRIGNARNRS